ncbi:MAG: hypothetical protein QW035_03595 [Candidatus Anstonellales archaeon]
MTSIIRIPQTMVEQAKEACSAIKGLVKAKLSVSEDGTVEIEGDALEEQRVCLVMKAIGRGFDKEDALLLLDDEYELRAINLKDYFSSPGHFKRIKGRVIGRGGSIKKSIESSTFSRISVWGNHISIIAPYYSLPYAEEAVGMIIRGSKHSTLGNYLSKARKDLIYTQLKGEKNV